MKKEKFSVIYSIQHSTRRRKKRGRKYMARSLAPPFCTPVNTRTYYLQDLLLTMVIFVLLIWLWVWCNAVAGYFVPSFPSSFRPPPFVSIHETLLFTAKREHDEWLARPHLFRFISDDDFRSSMKRNFSTAGQRELATLRENVTNL